MDNASVIGERQPSKGWGEVGADGVLSIDTTPRTPSVPQGTRFPSRRGPRWAQTAQPKRCQQAVVSSSFPFMGWSEGPGV